MDEARSSWKEQHEVPAWSFSPQICDAGAFFKFTKLDDKPLFGAAHLLCSWRATQGIYRLDTGLVEPILGA